MSFARPLTTRAQSMVLAGAMLVATACGMVDMLLNMAGRTSWTLANSLVALAVMVALPVTTGAQALAREDLALALSVVLLGMLMMITRRNAILQVVGLMSLENGLILAAVGVAGMPLVVELSTAALVMMLLVVGGVFVFQIRERFDTVDIGFLERHRGESG
jgi:hydrogenase-4 component E